MGHLQTWGGHLQVSYLFAFSYCSWGSRGRNTGVVCHSLLQWTTCCQKWVCFCVCVCQNSPPWPVHLWWPCTAQLIASFSQVVMGFLAQPYDLVGLTKPRSWWVVLNAIVPCGQMPHLPGPGSMLAAALQKAYYSLIWWYAFVHRPQVPVLLSTATCHIQNSTLISQTL